MRLKDSHGNDTHALAQVRSILGPNMTMAQAATWPDFIKHHAIPATDTLGKEFVIANPNHGDFHYVDLPYQLTRYELGLPGTHDDSGPNPAHGAKGGDIVQMSNECIRVLKGESQRFSKNIALRLLIHYMGDLHQPLHVGIGYVAAQPSTMKLVFVEPTSSTLNPQREDFGGNALFPNSKNLHSLWDGPAVTKNLGSQTESQYAATLFGTYTPTSSWNASGSLDHWVEDWAGRMLYMSKKAYRPVSITAELAAGDLHGTWPPYQFSISYSTSPAAYLTMARETTPMLLAKAGYRLAKVLKTIWP
jgi:hypothetical protein